MWQNGPTSSETVFSREGLWVVADFRPDGRLLLEKLKGNLYSEFFEWSPGDEQPTPVLGQDEMEEYSLRYGPRDGEFLVLTNKFGEYRQLFRFVSGSFQPISRKMKHDIDSFSIDHQRQRVLYEVNRDGYSEARAMNALSFDRIRLPETPGAQQVYFGATSPKRISRNCLIFNVEIVLGLRALERIGGHAKNIAGYVIYFATGKDVRHEDLETIETEILPQAE